MLELKIPAVQAWDEVNEEFIYIDEQVLQLEHSLAALSKWESKWCKPFLTNEQKTDEESLDYIRCMTLNDVDPKAYSLITQEQVDQVYEYIQAPMTATTFNSMNGNKSSGGSSIVTSELVYYWMVALKIPFECEHWHLNRLVTLIRVTEVKNAPPKKMNKRDVMSQYAELNKARRKKLNSKG